MNIASLSQQLNISVTELRKRMHEAGFRVSPKARKIDNILARDIVEKLKPRPRNPEPAKPATPRLVKIGPVISVRDLAGTLAMPVTAVIKSLIQNGVMASMNEQIDFDAAAIVAQDLGFEVTEEKSTSAGVGTVAEILAAEPQENLQSRPPIVAVMGHVDHGKTKLLDTIRSANVMATEAGSITQHIGAYKVEIPAKDQSNSQTVEINRGIPRQARDDGAGLTRTITFLDTPGLDAFAAMRARGANVTDIIVLVVAADDGVQQQTLEVVNRAKMTKTPMIVAINKIDKPDANQEIVKKQLAEAGVQPEEWGGNTVFVPISAKKNLGVDKLLEMILLTAEVANFQASPTGKTVGTVIESHLSKTQGPIASVIVQNGTLRVGDAVRVGGAYGKVRIMEDEHGRNTRVAGPSSPVRISGLSTVPEVGDLLQTYTDIRQAQTEAQYLLQSRTAKRLSMKTGISADAVNRQLNLILKADVQGSLEAILQELSKLENQDVKIKIVSQGIGDVNESDVLAADSSKATLIGFHNNVLPAAAKLAKQKNIHIDTYDIIYELTEDITKAILDLVLPEVEEVVVGRLKVLAVFRTEKDHMIIGGRVEEGKMILDRKVRIVRATVRVGDGKITELQQNKMEAREVSTGSECGMKVTTKLKIEKGDTLAIIEERMREKKLKRI